MESQRKSVPIKGEESLLPLSAEHPAVHFPSLLEERIVANIVVDVAPEILAETRRQGYGFPVDVWSSGVVLYICLCGFPPFSDELYTEENPYSLAMQIKLGLFDFPSPYWDSVTDLALDLIDSMVVVDMDRRHTVKQCISHPWMLYQTPQILDDGVRSASPDPIPEPSDSI